jgi:spore coat polysaccharide biosynthesis protein SpsF
MAKDKIRNAGVVAIIQARMGSSRLPGKVLREIEGQPMLHRVVVRARHAQTVGRVVVATTTEAGDDPLAAYCQRQGFPVFRGDPYDVLDRYYQAAWTFQAETVVRLTADCPLLDPAEVDRTVRAFQAARVDFAANRLPPPWRRTTPIGMDTEVVTMAALTRAWQEAEAKYAREHVMPYFYEEPGRFKTLLVDHEPDWGALRLTVDTAEDLELIRRITAHFGGGNDFGMAEVVAYLQQHPELGAINAGIHHKSFRDVDGRG